MHIYIHFIYSLYYDYIICIIYNLHGYLLWSSNQFEQTPHPLLCVFYIIPTYTSDDKVCMVNNVVVTLSGHVLYCAGIYVLLMLCM